MEPEQQALGGMPIDAGVGDGDAIFQHAQVLRNGLAPRLQVTLEHEPDNGAVAVHYLRDAVFGHKRLLAGIFVVPPVREMT